MVIRHVKRTIDQLVYYLFSPKNILKGNPDTLMLSLTNISCTLCVVIGRLRNPQDALLTQIEKWKKGLDKSEYSGEVFMDLSKAFATITMICS